jgi:Zn-dependent protease with chaperone function
MSKFCQVLLVSLYVLMTSYSVIALLKFWGLPISHHLTLGLLLGWVLYCFSSMYFRPGIFLAHLHVRRPLKAEEDKLNGYFQEVLGQAGMVKKFQLLIEEEMGCNAFAVGLRTIVVSRGALDNMAPEELKGVLAHELGHLQSKDCLINTAFVAASFLPRIVTAIYENVKPIFLRREIISGFWVRVRFRYRLLVLLIGVLVYCDPHSVLPLLATGLLVLAFRKINIPFLFLNRIISRFREYRQDKYACQLGYGAGLRQVLHKSTLSEPQSVAKYEILMREDHPVIYNRIRRLEKLEGVR